MAIELQNRVSLATQLSKPSDFGHRMVLAGGFTDVASTWLWGPHVGCHSLHLAPSSFPRAAATPRPPAPASSPHSPSPRSPAPLRPAPSARATTVLPPWPLPPISTASEPCHGRRRPPPRLSASSPHSPSPRSPTPLPPAPSARAAAAPAMAARAIAPKLHRLRHPLSPPACASCQRHLTLLPPPYSGPLSPVPWPPHATRAPPPWKAPRAAVSHLLPPIEGAPAPLRPAALSTFPHPCLHPFETRIHHRHLHHAAARPAWAGVRPPRPARAWVSQQGELGRRRELGRRAGGSEAAGLAWAPGERGCRRGLGLGAGRTGARPEAAVTGACCPG